MDVSKSAFFDTQVDTAWASAPYTQQEHERIDQVLASAGLASGMNVLEPGSGTGRLTDIIAEKVGPLGLVCAVDISKKMVKRTSRRMAGVSNCRVFHCSVEEHVKTAQTYDLIICHNVFHHFQDKRTVLCALASVLKKGGKLLIFHFLSFDQINDPQRKIHPTVLNDTIPDLAEMESLCCSVGMGIDSYSDDEKGYLLTAGRCLPAE